MRIAWFTPFEKNSAIGQVSKLICEKLSDSENIDIWTAHNDNLIDTDVTVVKYDSETALEALNKYDYIIYNMGNFAGYHREIYDVSQKYPGVVILHDQTYHGFWGQYYTFNEYGGDSVNGYAPYFESFKKFYGEGAAQEAIKAAQENVYPIYECDYLLKYNFVKAVINNAKAIFTHARFMCDYISKITNIPIGYTYLPCGEAKTEGCDSDFSNWLNSISKGRKLIVSTGIVHPVKQIDKVVNILLNNPLLANKIVYVVVGSYGGEYGEKLKKYSENELKDSLYILGYQPYSVMNTAIIKADLCINMRYPNTEVCSLSLFEQMSYGKAIVSLDSGIYGELPNGALINISVENIEEELTAFLNDFVSDELNLESFEINAKRFIEENCSIDNYCNNLIDFLFNLNNNYALKSLQNRYLTDVAYKIKELGISELNAQSTVNAIFKNAFNILNEKNSEAQKTIKTIGVWFGFVYEIPNLNREGVSRFIGYMMGALSKNYNVKFEAWCYSFNEKEVEIICDTVPSDKLKIITEKNWKDKFDISVDDIKKIGVVDCANDNLNVVARRFSKSDIMIPVIIYLDNVIGTGKQIFVPAHDVAVADRFNDFIAEDKNYKFRNEDITARMGNYAKYNAKFMCISKTVCETQVLKYIRNIKPEDTKVIYIPAIIPKDLEHKILPVEELKKRFNIPGRFFFYPTQIRPYKNITLLIKALAILVKKYKDLSLVLTGNPNDVPEVEMLIRENGLEEKIILVKGVNEQELYSLYKHSSAVPIPTLCEGGFPLQAIEAMAMGSPAVLSDIPNVRERIDCFGLTIENCGLCTFDPYDEHDFAQKLQFSLEDRDEVVMNQNTFSEKLLSYTWDDASKEYYDFFCR